MRIEVKENPVSYGVNDFVLNRYNQICQIEAIRYYPNAPLKDKPNIDVRVKEGKNSWCVYDIHTLRGNFEVLRKKKKKYLIDHLGEKYE